MAAKGLGQYIFIGKLLKDLAKKYWTDLKIIWQKWPLGDHHQIIQICHKGSRQTQVSNPMPSDSLVVLCSQMLNKGLVGGGGGE